MYKDLTKGKAAPMGGVAYLNLEDSEVNPPFAFPVLSSRVKFQLLTYYVLSRSRI